MVVRCCGSRSQPPRTVNPGWKQMILCCELERTQLPGKPRQRNYPLQPVSRRHTSGTVSQGSYRYCLPAAYAEYNLLAGGRRTALDYFAQEAVAWHQPTVAGPTITCCLPYSQQATRRHQRGSGQQAERPNRGIRSRPRLRGETNERRITAVAGRCYHKMNGAQRVLRAPIVADPLGLEQLISPRNYGRRRGLMPN